MSLITLVLLQATIARADDCPASRRALLVGINEYAAPSLPDLRGAINDIELLRRILITRFAFADENIRLLTDEQATRAGILEAIDDFVDGGCPDDVIYFHYSGHGSQAEDFSGDESEGRDETILPHDARTDGIPDILDDELDQRFVRLRARNALIVFDSCHSGTVTRSANVTRPRAVPPDRRVDLYRSLALRTRSVVPVEGLPHVLMTSAPADEEALDGPLDDGFYGLFSFSLGRSLDLQGPAGTPEQILAGAKRELRRIQDQLYTRPPEPQLEAPPDLLQRPVLPVAAGSAEPPARRAWLQVQPVNPGQARLVDGAALNARPGSQWAIYPPGELAFRYGEAAAVGVVTALAGADAVVQLRSAQDRVQPGARAIALAPPDVSSRQPVSLLGVPDRRREAIMAMVRAELPAATLAAPGEFARLSVILGGGGWTVLDAAGVQEITSFADASDGEVAERLVKFLSWSTRATSLLSLDNPASDIQLWVGVRTSFVESQPPPATRGLVLVADDPAPEYRFRRDEERRTPGNSLTLEVRADRDVYITVASVDTEGHVQLLFPNDYQRPGFLPAGRLPGNQTVRIPDSLDSGNRAGFHWDFGPPAGRDTIRVFAAEELAIAERIREVIRRSGDDPGALSVLKDDLASTMVRGIRVVPDSAPAAAPTGNDALAAPPGQWTAASVTFLVRE